MWDPNLIQLMAQKTKRQCLSGGKCIKFACYDLIDVNFTIFIS